MRHIFSFRSPNLDTLDFDLNARVLFSLIIHNIEGSLRAPKDRDAVREIWIDDEHLTIYHKLHMICPRTDLRSPRL